MARPLGRSVLVITHAFPPAGGSGIERTLGFVRSLAIHGWRPIVLTVRRPVGAGWDEDLLGRVPDDVEVIRTAWFDPAATGRRLIGARRHGGGRSDDAVPPAGAVAPSGRWRRAWAAVRDRVMIPDDAIGWYPFAVAAGRRAVRRGGISALYSTSPPPTNHLVARALHRRTGVPWVADVRDLWTDTPYEELRRPYRHRWRLRLERRMEAGVLTVADRVVTVTEPFRRSLLGRSEALDPSRTILITNGFDQDAFAGLERSPPDRLTVTYTGKFYGDERSPSTFLSALEHLIADGDVDRDRIRIRVMGISAADAAAAVSAHELDDVVTVLGQVPHRQALQEQLDASVLLLVVGDAPGERDAIPAKVFEYLAARRPILALAPPGSPAAEVVERTGAGTVVDPKDRPAIAAAILARYREFMDRGDVAWDGDAAVIGEYARPGLTARLAEVLDDLVPARSAGA